MKKIIALLVTLLLVFSLSLGVGCAEPKGTLVFMVPDGAPALTISSLIGKKIGGYEISYQVVPAETIGAQVSSGAADIAIMPTNAGANLYNKGTNIKLVTANVHGLLYLVGKESVTSLQDLKGKIVYNIGQGNTPDVTFRHILSENGIECVISDVPVEGKVALQFVSEGSALVPLLNTNVAKFAILGEPMATQTTRVAGTTVLFDIQEEWSEVTGRDSFPQASLFIKGSLSSDSTLINELVSLLETNDTWVKSHATEAQTAIKGIGSTIAVTLDNGIVERCNLITKKASTAKTEIVEYLNVLYNFNSAFIGGKLPDDGFYYAG